MVVYTGRQVVKKNCLLFASTARPQ